MVEVEKKDLISAEPKGSVLAEPEFLKDDKLLLNWNRTKANF